MCVHNCACVHMCYAACEYCVCINVYVSICMCVCVFMCMYVCSNRVVSGGSPVGAIVVFLSKELHSHCSSPSSCINRYLALAKKENTKLVVSC